MPEFDFGSLINKELSPEKVTISNNGPSKSPGKVTPPSKPKSKSPKRVTKKPLHILTEENLIRFVQEQERTKPYEMKIRFYQSSSNEIQKIVNYLIKKGKLTRNKNGWISLKKGGA